MMFMRLYGLFVHVISHIELIESFSSSSSHHSDSFQTVSM